MLQNVYASLTLDTKLPFYLFISFYITRMQQQDKTIDKKKNRPDRDIKKKRFHAFVHKKKK